mmetsp:Transcript_42855/g.76883  ORF Transcript_42855/g.76883 Transcript_42855/m.76883 type:complete len:87 (+) Transcript_42855:479-739(+)
MLRSARQAGMLDAVVDWFLLAGSRTIIGNVESSFALSASVRNGIRYSVAYNDPRLCNMGGAARTTPLRMRLPARALRRRNSTSAKR